MHFLHVADIHLGAHLACFYNEHSMLHRLVELADQRHIHDIVLIGDIFDKPHPDQRVKDYLLDVITGCPHINWYFVIGNHDYTNKDRDYHSLVYLQLIGRAIDYVHVCEPGQSYEFDSFNLLVLDDDYKVAKVINDRPNVLAFHGILKGIFNLSRSKAAVEFSDQLLTEYDAEYLALGDIHKHMKISDRCWYPGALIQKTYACEDGLLDIEIAKSDLPLKVTSLSLDLPKKLTLNITLTEEDFTAERSVEDLIIDSVNGIIDPNSLLRLKFKLPVHLWTSIDKDKLRERFSGLLELKLDNSPVVEIRESGDSLDDRTVEGDIDDVISSLNTELDKSKLKALCLDIIDERKD